MKTLRSVLTDSLLLIFPTQARAVDLALVLTVDASSSVSYGEFNLQMIGIADAFRDESVQAAIELATPNGMVVTMVQWSSINAQRQAFLWIIVRGAADGEAVAAAIDRTPRLSAGGGTAIGNAIEFSMNLIKRSRIHATRWVIDVLDDGRDNMGPEFANRGRPAGNRRQHHHQRTRHPQRGPLARAILPDPCCRRCGSLHPGGRRLRRFRRGHAGKADYQNHRRAEVLISRLRRLNGIRGVGLGHCDHGLKSTPGSVPLTIA